MGHRQTPELLPGWPIFYRRNKWQVCGCRQWSTTHLLLQRLWGSCTSRWNRKPVQKFFLYNYTTQLNSDTHNIRTFKIDSTYNRYDLIINLIIIGWRTTYIAKVWFVCFFDACMYHVCIYIIFVGIYSRPRTSCTVLAFFNLYSRLLYCIHYSIRSIERNFSLLYI